MDDASFESDATGEELAAVARALAELGERPLPEAVAQRLDARLAAELDSTPLTRRRARRPLRIGAGLTAVAAAAAVLVFALSTGGGHRSPPGQAAAAGTSAADSAAPAAKAATGLAPTKTFAVKAACPPASRTGDGHRPAGCPGARGGHARAV